jgi:imidazolonepropionase-like amidohydrolase
MSGHSLLRVLLCVTAVAWLAAGCSAVAPANLAIRHATVVDVTDGSLAPDRTVLITGDRITAIGPVDEVDVPDRAEVVDAGGGYLVPGLWDMHVHIARDVDRAFPLLLAYGVTGVRNMNPGMDSAIERTRDVEQQLASGAVSGPRWIAGGPTVDGDPPVSTRPIVVHDEAEGRAAVDTLADAGMDFVKVYENVPRHAYFAIADQARRRGIPVVGHLPFRVRPEEAAAAGQRTFEHLRGMEWGCSSDAEALREETDRVIETIATMSPADQVMTVSRHTRALYESWDQARCEATADAYRRHGAAVVPTLIQFHQPAYADEALSDPAMVRFVPESERQEWEDMMTSQLGRAVRADLAVAVPVRERTVKLLNAAGVTILSGTDVGGGGPILLVPGASLHDELALLAESGLSALDALRAATLEPARVLGMADSFGTVEVGRLADLALLDANPLEDIRNTRTITAVVANGRLYRRADLDRLLAEAEAASKRE